MKAMIAIMTAAIAAAALTIETQKMIEQSRRNRAKIRLQLQQETEQPLFI